MDIPHQVNQPGQIVGLPGAVRGAMPQDVFDFDDFPQCAAIRGDDLKVGRNGDTRRCQRTVDIVPSPVNPHVRVCRMGARRRLTVGKALPPVKFDVIHPVGSTQEGNEGGLFGRYVPRPLGIFRVLPENRRHPHPGAGLQLSISNCSDSGMPGLVPGEYRRCPQGKPTHPDPQPPPTPTHFLTNEHDSLYPAMKFPPRHFPGRQPGLAGSRGRTSKR